MTLIQTVVWFASLIIIILIAAMFLWVAVKSKEESDYKPIVKKWYKARSIYGVILVLVMFAVTIYTLRELPFNKPICVIFYSGLFTVFYWTKKEKAFYYKCMLCRANTFRKEAFSWNILYQKFMIY